MTPNKVNDKQTTMQDVTELCQAFTKQMGQIVSDEIKKAEFDKTYYGLISAVYFNNDTDKSSKEYQMYQISYNGYTQDVYIRDGIIHSVGDRVLVTLPNGKHKDRYIEVLTKNDYPLSIELSEDKDKLIKTQIDAIGEELVSEYLIERDSDGKITKITFPSGRVMNVKGF